jgi:hypothetical protein
VFLSRPRGGAADVFIGRDQKLLGGGSARAGDARRGAVRAIVRARDSRRRVATRARATRVVDSRRSTTNRRRDALDSRRDGVLASMRAAAGAAASP